MSSSSFLRLLPRLLVRSIFPSKTCFEREFLLKIWQIQLAFLSHTLYRIFLSCLTLCNIFSLFTLAVRLIYPILLQYHISELLFLLYFTKHSSFSIIQSYAATVCKILCSSYVYLMIKDSYLLIKSAIQAVSHQIWCGLHTWQPKFLTFTILSINTKYENTRCCN